MKKRIIILFVFFAVIIFSVTVNAQLSEELLNYNPATQDTTINPHPSNRRYVDPNDSPVYRPVNINDDPYKRYTNNNKKESEDPNWYTRIWKDEYGNCLIKGNVSYKSGQKIYHVPGWKDYDATVIDKDFGERWFCTEQEAYEAGWRAPYYIKRTYPKK